MALTFRDTKGSPLTSAEADANVRDLDTRVTTAKQVADAAQPKVAGKGLSTNDYDNTEKAKVTNAQPKEAGKGLSTNDYTTIEKTKLGGVATGATANATNAQLRDRSTHTGSQLASTISDFASAALGTVLTGLSLLTATPVLATDSILVAFGKLQAQISAFGTAALLTATTSTTDTTTGRAVRIGDHGTGSQVSPFIPDMDAPVANGYSWVTSGTLNQITGWASGSQVLTFFASAAEIAQMFFSRTVPMRVGIRRKTTNVWQTMAELITSASAILDPALGTGGVISTSVVSGFRVDKYLSGAMCLTGKVSLASQPANSNAYQTLTLPVTFFSVANMIPLLTCNANATSDIYGVTFQRAASTSSILYAVRNGATAQTFEVNVCVWGTWK